MSTETPDVTIVAPCYNEGLVIEATYKRLRQVCDQHGYSVQLLFIDDGSTDNTWELLSGFAQQDPEVCVLKLSRNFGHQRALAAGLHHATGQRILIIDADLQDPPELLPEMMAVMDKGYDNVYGQRIRREGEYWHKKLTAMLFYRFCNLMSDIDVPHDTGDFRLISRRLLEGYLSMPEEKRLHRLIFAWLGYASYAFRYERAARYAGHTKYNYRKLTNMALDGITSFSTRPLRVAIVLALGMVAMACGLFLWVMRAWWLGVPVQGWASIIASVLMVGATQLVVLGIIGEYMGRLFLESKRRPEYVVETALGPVPEGSDAPSVDN
jgi:dolichol-phosphate mannosyltransferase